MENSTSELINLQEALERLDNDMDLYMILVDAFLQENPFFKLNKLPLPAEIRQEREGMLKLIPGQYDTDGFFICCMRRE